MMISILPLSQKQARLEDTAYYGSHYTCSLHPSVRFTEMSLTGNAGQGRNLSILHWQGGNAPWRSRKDTTVTKANKRFNWVRSSSGTEHVGESPGGEYEKALVMEIRHEEKPSHLTVFSQECDWKKSVFLLRKIFIPQTFVKGYSLQKEYS